MLKIDNSIGLITIHSIVENRKAKSLDLLNTLNTGLSLRVYLPSIFWIPLIPHINNMYFDLYATLINIIDIKNISTESQILGLSFNFPLPSIFKFISLELCAGAQYMCNSLFNRSIYLQFFNPRANQNYFIYGGVNLILSTRLINFRVSMLRTIPMDINSYEISFGKYQDLFLEELYA